MVFLPLFNRTVVRKEEKLERGGAGSGKVRKLGLEHGTSEAQRRYISTRYEYWMIKKIYENISSGNNWNIKMIWSSKITFTITKRKID